MELIVSKNVFIVASITSVISLCFGIATTITGACHQTASFKFVVSSQVWAASSVPCISSTIGNSS